MGIIIIEGLEPYVAFTESDLRNASIVVKLINGEMYFVITLGDRVYTAPYTSENYAILSKFGIYFEVFENNQICQKEMKKFNDFTFERLSNDNNAGFDI